MAFVFNNPEPPRQKFFEFSPPLQGRGILIGSIIVIGKPEDFLKTDVIFLWVKH